MMKSFVCVLSVVGVCLTTSPSFGADAVTGEIDLNGESRTYAGLSGDGVIKNSSDTLATVTINTADDAMDFTGTIQGNIAVVKTGAGKQKFNAGNTFTGGLRIEGGLISVGRQSALGANGGVTLKSGGGIEVTANFTSKENRITIEDEGVVSVAKGVAHTISSNGFGSVNAVLRKTGSGQLATAGHFRDVSVANSRWVIESGTLYIGSGDTLGSHNADITLTIELCEGAVLNSEGHVPLGPLVFRGGRIDANCIRTDTPGNTNTLFDVSALSPKWKTFSFNGPMTVYPSPSGAPSAVRVWESYLAHVDFENVFDVKENAVLELDVALYPGFTAAGSGVPPKPGDIIKRGKGTLKILRTINSTGVLHLEEGTVVIGRNAALNSQMKIKSSGTGRIVLEDDAVLKNDVTVPNAFLSTADIWVDAAQVDAADGEEITSFPNLGACGGTFKKFDNMHNVPKYVANGMNGLPAFAFDMYCGFGLCSYTNTSHNMTVFIVKKWTSWEYDDTKGKYGSACAFGVQDENGKEENGVNGSLSFMRWQNPFTTLTIRHNPGDYKYDITTAGGIQKPLLLVNKVTAAGSTTWSYAGDDQDTTTASKTFPNPSDATKFNINLVALGCRIKNGGGNNMRGLNGHIGEMLVFSRELSDDDFNRVQNYLKRKWFNSTASVDTTSGAENPLVIEVDEGEEATLAALARSSAGASAHSAVVKTGPGTLNVLSMAEGPTTLDVEEGAVALKSGAIPSRADIWVDPSDESTVVLDAEGKVVSMRNKGRVGGLFTQQPAVGGGDAPYPRYDREGLNGRAMLAIDGCAALATKAYTNKGEHASLHIYGIFRMSSYAHEGGKGRWTSPFSMSTVTGGNDDSTAGCFYFSQSEHIISLRNKGDSTAVFDRGFTNSPYLFIAHSERNAFLYSQILPTDEDKVNVYFRNGYLVAGGPDVDIVQLGGRLQNGKAQYYKNAPDSSRMWVGDVGEFIVINEKLTNAEEAELLAYLRKKWFNYGDDSASATPPEFLTGKSMTLQTTDQTHFVLGEGTTLTHAAGTLPLASLAAANDVTWNRTVAGGASVELFDVKGDVTIAGAQTLAVDPMPSITATLFSYGGLCTMQNADWTIRGENVGSVTVKDFPKAGEVRLYRDLGTIIIFR